MEPHPGSESTQWFWRSDFWTKSADQVFERRRMSRGDSIASGTDKKLRGKKQERDDQGSEQNQEWEEGVLHNPSEKGRWARSHCYQHPGSAAGYQEREQMCLALLSSWLSLIKRFLVRHKKNRKKKIKWVKLHASYAITGLLSQV